MIYLDNASSTQVAPEVIEAMQPYLDKWYGNPSTIHSLGRNAKEAIDKAREIIANKINAQPEEIIFTSGGTEANNLAVKGIKNNDVITTTTEHQSVLNVCNSLKTFSLVDVDEEGFVDLNKLENTITSQTTLVSVIHGNNEIGTVNDIAAIGKLCKEKDVLFHSDTCQSFLKEKIDVQKMNVDLLTINSHKVHGPKGVGALYVRKGVKLSPVLHGGGQEFNQRAGTENVAGIVGFAKAIEIWKESDNELVKGMRDVLIKELLAIKDTKLNGSKDKRLCNNINISFKNVEGESIIKHLDNHKILASTGSACTAHQIEPSHVLKAIGLPEEWALGSVRFSLSKYNTEEEIKTTVDTISEIVESLRRIG